MNAIVLAGGEAPPELATVASWSTPARDRALIGINGKPIIEYILESLRATPAIENIVVVAPQSTLDVVVQLAPDVIRVASGDKLTDNILTGTRACEGRSSGQSTQALICTCDIPLVTPETWEQLLQGVSAKGLEAAYPIVRRETIEAAFPGGKRTYATLKDGTFTGGNAFILPLQIVPQLAGLIETAYQARKNPMAIAKILGMGFVLKALSKKLSVLDIEAKMSQILKCRAGAVEMQDATIAFDVDKAVDYQVVQKAIAAQTLS